MKRRYVVTVLLIAGCSTNPVADVYDFAHPAKGVCAKANFGPSGPLVPGQNPACPAAFNENQNYRKGLLERFRRNYPSGGAPPADAVPAAAP